MHLEVANRTISYDRRGQGEPLLLIMGMAGHRGLWREDFFDLLADGFDVVCSELIASLIREHLRAP